jgi:hypothetical protein
MRERGILANVYVDLAGKTQLSVRGHDHLFQFRLRHPFMNRLVGCLIGRQCDLVGQAHQVKFMLTLDHAAAGGHRRGGNQLRRGRRVTIRCSRITRPSASMIRISLYRACRSMAP